MGNTNHGRPILSYRRELVLLKFIRLLGRNTLLQVQEKTPNVSDEREIPLFFEIQWDFCIHSVRFSEISNSLKAQL